MKKVFFSLTTVMCLLVTASCSSKNEISFDSATGSRNNGSNFNPGQLSYSDSCIYNMFDDGIYEYDTAGKTITKVVDFEKIGENTKPYNSAFACIPGYMVIASPSTDSMEYDESDGTITVINNLYVTNLKGELKDTIAVKYRKKENDENNQPGIESFYTFFMIDSGWVYGYGSGKTVRYDVDTEEVQVIGSNVCCIAGDYIYFTDTNGNFCRAKEKDLSEKEEMKIFDKGDSPENPAYGDEEDSSLYIGVDGTILCRKQIYSESESDGGVWKDENWYSFKFGEKPQVIGDGLSEFDKVFYAGGNYYTIKVSEKSSEEERVQTVQLIEIDGKTLEKKIIFDGETKGRIPTMAAEKFIILGLDRNSAKIYNIETKELVDCTL